MSHPVAIVTGAASGIGLALTEHLLSKGWRVALADINAPPSSANLPKESSKYIRCDVSSWESQASMFAEAFSWGGRLDFAALNAGIDDRDDIFDSIDPENPPRKPNMDTFEVNLLGVYYGAKLAAHYMSRKATPGGKIAITASSAGLYALPSVPQYCATKFGLVGLTRSFAPKAIARGITVNAICPAMVRTNLAPPGLMDEWPDDQTTPMSTMIRAYDELLDDEKNWNGQIVEVSLGDLYFREEMPFPNPSQRKMSKESVEAWNKAYRERNCAFARRDWEKEKRESKA